MIIDVNEKIKQRRIELGLTETDISKQVGLSLNEYFDIELYADEIYTVTALSQVKKLLRVLKLDFFELFEMRCVFCDEEQNYKNYTLPRNELIRKRRDEKGLSSEELGDRVGFHEVEIANLETKPNHLETWPIDLIKDLATEINMPLQILFDVKCKKCEEEKKRQS